MSRSFVNIQTRCKTIGIIGTGSLGESLINMLLRRPNFSLSPVSVVGSTLRSDRIVELRNTIISENLLLTVNNHDVIEKADEILLTVKPGQIKMVCDTIRPLVSKNTPIISAAAAIPLEKLHQWLPETKMIIRCMPNIPCNIGDGIVPYITKSDSKLASSIINNIFAPNKTLPLSTDSEIDISTLIAGCGPALFAWYSKCIQQIGTGILLDQDLTLMLTQTMKGTAAMLQTHSTDNVIRAVASPKGATEAIINKLGENKVEEEINKALLMAKNRIKCIAETL